MPDPFIPNMLRVSCQGGIAGSEVWANVWHIVRQVDNVFLNLPLSLLEANAIAEEFADFYAGQADNRDVSWSLTRIVVSDRSQANAPSFDAVTTTPALPVSGIQAGEVLPNQVALVLSLRTAINSRRHRGRIFLCGFGESNTQESPANASASANTATVDDVVNNATAMIADLKTINYDLVVFSRTALNGVATPVTSIRVGNVFDTQRRRRNKVIESYSAASV